MEAWDCCEEDPPLHCWWPSLGRCFEGAGSPWLPPRPLAEPSSLLWGPPSRVLNFIAGNALVIATARKLSLLSDLSVLSVPCVLFVLSVLMTMITMTTLTTFTTMMIVTMTTISRQRFPGDSRLLFQYRPPPLQADKENVMQNSHMSILNNTQRLAVNMRDQVLELGLICSQTKS